MVVDDSTSVRKSLERVLEIHGFSMQGVTSAAEALRQAGVRRPDLVLSEVDLPDLSGLELCRRLSLAGLPVLLMSQESGPRARELSRAAGALELLGKPLDQQTLLGSLSRQLGLSLAAVPRPPGQSELLHLLMTRPGVLGAGLFDRQGRALAVAGQAFPGEVAARSSDFIGALEALGQQSGSGPLRSFQIEFETLSLLIVQLPGPAGERLVCWLHDVSYASLVTYLLRAQLVQPHP